MREIKFRIWNTKYNTMTNWEDDKYGMCEDIAH